MHSHPDIIFKLCVVSADEMNLKRATAKAWQQYALARVPPDAQCWADGSDITSIVISPFEAEGAGTADADPRLWFRVRADALHYARHYATEIGDPYDRECIVNQLRYIYTCKMKPVIEYELGAKIGIVESAESGGYRGM